ncbi:helix-turn-helix transcriptional regulator [Atopobiaceae bacterium 24-176]
MGYRIRLKAIRTDRGVTQEEMAKRLNVKLPTYRTWERGQVNMTLENAYKCSVILGCTPNDLCNWYEDHPQDRVGSDPLPIEEARLLRGWRSLDERGRETVETVMDVQVTSIGDDLPEEKKSCGPISM